MDPITLALGLVKLTGLDAKIGRLIAGDNGEQVATKVIDIAQTVTGEQSPDTMLRQLHNNTNKKMALKHAINKQVHQLKRLAFEDRADARSMQVAALNGDDHFSKRFVYYFAIAWSVFAFVYLVMITFTEIPSANIRFADTVLGFLLGTVLAGMFGFFYGSSAGNERRSEQENLHRVIQQKWID